MVVCLNGYPGAGKTFICRKMVKEFGFVSLEIGQKLRQWFGDGAFLQTENPRAPDKFEQPVRNMINTAINLAKKESSCLVIDSTPRTSAHVLFLLGMRHASDMIGLGIRTEERGRSARIAERSTQAVRLALAADIGPEEKARVEFCEYVSMGVFNNNQSWEDYDARGTLSTLILSTWARRGTPGIIHGGGIRSGGKDDLPDPGSGSGGTLTGSGQSPGGVQHPSPSKRG